MTWTELHFDHAPFQDEKGNGLSRAWNVKGFTPEVARTQPEAPYFGQLDPENPFLACNFVDFQPIGLGTRVTARYVPLEFLPRVPPENTTAVNWIGTDSTFVPEDVKIPVFELVRKSFPNPTGGVQTKLVFRAKERVKTYTYMNVTHRVTLNATVAGGDTVNAQMAITEEINKQNNKLHKINNRFFLFNADGVRRIEKDFYQFTYRWTSDIGVINTLTPLFDSSASPNLGLIGSDVFPYFDEDFIVRPFKILETAPVGNDPTQAPTVRFSDRYLIDENGYLNLPGIG